jgi:hypothetical protein
MVRPRPEPAKSPETPNSGQIAKNPTRCTPRHGLFIRRPLSCPWWNTERGRAAARLAKACAVWWNPIPGLSQPLLSGVQVLSV